MGGNFTGKRRGVFERNRRGGWITVLYRMLFRLGKKMFVTRWVAILRKRGGVFLNVTIEGVG